VLWAQSKKLKTRKREKKATEVSGQNPSGIARNKTEKRGVDVLYFMVVTAAMFHFERSALNARDCWNAVGVVGAVCGCWLLGPNVET